MKFKRNPSSSTSPFFNADRHGEINNVVITNIFQTHLNLNDKTAKNTEKKMPSEYIWKS